MARQAEAERERRAKVIAAEGEFQASQKLSGGRGRDGALADGPAAPLPADAARDQGDERDHDRLPAPIDMLTAFMGKAGGTGGGTSSG